MEGGWLNETIYQISHYSPVVIIFASTLDIFFLTGFLFYGAAMMSTVLMMHMAGMISTEALIISAFFGTTLGNTINFLIGRRFGETAFVQNRLQRPKLLQAQRFLQTRGLIIFMIIGRFITFTRPLYALLLGSMRISFHRFLAIEIPLALFWVTFWLLIILYGEKLWFRFSG